MNIRMAQVQRAAAKHVWSQTINGNAAAALSCFQVVNPATGRVFVDAPDTSPQQLEAAITYARRAQAGWGALSVAERRLYLHRFVESLLSHREELAELITLEQGKPLPRAYDEVDRTALLVKQLMKIELPVEILPGAPGWHVELHHAPLGVVGAVTPWNMPLILSFPKAIHALYTGNTIIIKPSPYTPLTALRVGELSREILPPGVFNVVSGGNDLGQWMTEHPGLDKISFTGSVPTGKRVLSSAAGTLKRVTLELGGNDAAIVLDDADPRAIAPALFAASFANSGQVCMAIKRLYVHERIHPDVCDELANLCRSARIGDGFEEGVDLGPLQNEVQYRFVLELLDDARRAGGHIVGGGAPLERPGFFVTPTIVTGLPDHCSLVQQEPFGPVLPVLSFSDVDEAVSRANDTRFGLCGSVWSADVLRGGEVARRLEVGTAWVNRHMGWHGNVPFGGAKESGFGVECGLEGLKHYTRMQALHMPNIDGSK